MSTRRCPGWRAAAVPTSTEPGRPPTRRLPGPPCTGGQEPPPISGTPSTGVPVPPSEGCRAWTRGCRSWGGTAGERADARGPAALGVRPARLGQHRPGPQRGHQPAHGVGHVRRTAGTAQDRASHRASVARDAATRRARRVGATTGQNTSLARGVVHAVYSRVGGGSRVTPHGATRPNSSAALGILALPLGIAMCHSDRQCGLTLTAKRMSTQLRQMLFHSGIARHDTATEHAEHLSMTEKQILCFPSRGSRVRVPSPAPPFRCSNSGVPVARLSVLAPTRC